MSSDNTVEAKARNLSLLVMILLLLHVLFGVTAIAGMLIAHTNRHKARNTIYYSHLRLQIITFWLALAGYAAVVWAWISHDMHMLWPALLVAGFVTLSVLINLVFWSARLPFGRSA